LLKIILGLIIFAIIGVAIIAPVVALILHWLTINPLKKGGK